MDAEFTALEEKITQAAQLCRRLRLENRDLRLQLAALENEKKQLAERIEDARNHLENVLKQIPD